MKFEPVPPNRTVFSRRRYSEHFLPRVDAATTTNRNDEAQRRGENAETSDETRTTDPRAILRRTLAITTLAVVTLFQPGCSTESNASREPSGGTAPLPANGGLGATAGGAGAPSTGGTHPSSGGTTSATGGAAAGGVSGGSKSAGGASAGRSGGPSAGGSSGSAGQNPGGGNSGLGGTAPVTGGAATSGGSAGVGGGGRGGAQATGGAGGSGGNAPPITKKFVGNIDARAQIRPDFVNYWNQFTPENAGKWGSVERTRDQMNWTTLDRMYEYSKQHNVVFKQHTLLWGSQQPSWLSGLSAAEQREEVEEWIRLFCERYPDTKLIDVVNEPPPHTTPPYVAALGGSGTSGYDWIAQAFRWADQYCPDAILLLNDYNNIEYAADNSRTIDIAKKIAAAGAPIDAVGAQAHDAFRLSTNTVQGYIDKITAETGLPVYITEYDIDLADDNQQRNVMESQFTMFWNNQNVHGITIWGYVSGMTWKANTGLMSSSGTPRPAMTWLLEFLDIK